MNRFEWTDAATVREAVAQLNGRAVVKAGGVDLLDRLKEGLEAPERLVNIRNIRGLDRIAESRSGLSIGPLVTLARLSEDKLLLERYRAVAQAAGRAATPQIRNMATVGGNLLQRPRCWYFRQEEFHCRRKGGERCFALDGENQYHAVFDNQLCAIVHPSALAVPLMAMGASVVLTGRNGTREVELERFFLKPEQNILRENVIAPDELITEVRVPPLAPATRSFYIKQGEKESFDWPVADVAVVMQTKGNVCQKASIVMGAAAPVPWRAGAAEKLLTGRVINEQSAREAARLSVQGATPLAQNAYKLAIFEAIVRRAILKTVSG
ncbi:MAG TPA: FAD binding domain-containing protein [Pyrinomonadaceae bacterium]|nr:FAD binding domain-containing protein [Pyrinomonadaceae bacterium]